MREEGGVEINAGKEGAGSITAEARVAMAARLGVHGDFVHVPQLARALGMSSTTIYAQMRRGDFPIPHRRIGSVLVVKLDDYVLWFEQAKPEPKVVEARPQAVVVAIDEPPAELPHRPLPPVDASERQKRADFKARIQREVLEGMRRKGFKV